MFANFNYLWGLMCSYTYFETDLHRGIWIPSSFKPFLHGDKAKATAIRENLCYSYCKFKLYIVQSYKILIDSIMVQHKNCALLYHKFSHMCRWCDIGPSWI